jgi:hypothetical protein
MSGLTVEVSARKITVPYLCPCCCGVADTALAVSFTRITGERFMRETTRELDFPYCTRCVRHSRQWSAAWRAAAAVMAFGASTGVVAGVGFGAAVGVGVAAAACAIAVAVGLVLRSKARASCCPSCSGPGPAVTYHGWADHVQTFSFASRRYAAAFAEENEHTLVNVTPHLYQLLEQRRVSVPHPPPSRSPVSVPAPIRAMPQLPVSVPAPVRTTPRLPVAVPASARATPLWPQRERLDRARSVLHHVMRLNEMAKRSGPAS